jgi:hypothetical protein
MTSLERPTWRSAPVVLWVLALTVLVLAPLARPGYALLRDMVATPRQYLTDDAWGAGPALPRAVPVDAVLAVLTSILDGALVQRVALAAALILAGLGAARLAGGSTSVSLGAATLMVWNPYVAERLLMGHWTLLLAYSTLPWVAAACVDLRAGRAAAAWAVLGWTAIAALSPGGGLLVLLLVAPLLLWPGSAVTGRQRLAVLGGWLVLNAPWWLAGLLHPSAGRSDPDGVLVFAAQADTSLGVLGSLLGLGGVWNSDAVPPSRAESPAAVWTLVVLALAVAGFGELRRRWGPGAAALAFSAGLSVLLAGWGAWHPASLERLVLEFPGAGLLRDGHRLVAPLAVLLAVAAPWGAHRVGANLVGRSGRIALATLVVLGPVVVMMDLAVGALGAVAPVRFPAGWDQVRTELAKDPGRGDVVSLPWQPLRRYDWNDGRPVLDPAARYFPAEVVTSSDLTVQTRLGQITVEGEDARAAAVGHALDSGRPAVESLPPLGVRWLLVSRASPGEVPAGLLTGAARVVAQDGIELWRLPTWTEGTSTGRQRHADVLLVTYAAAFTLALGSWTMCARVRARPASIRR